MSLFGAMTSGVSGLAAQSSAMGSIADNITNVNTVGYKGTRVDFQTLVTKQASSSAYSAGGVQSHPRTGIDLQGLLQSSTASTNLAISGQGFFLVNESSTPGPSDQFLFTRAGAFYPDNEGFLRNTGGFFLQAWPTDALGNVILPPDSPASLPNQNVLSTEYLETINLNRVGGTATETSRISIGANLPANDAIDSQPHNIDVQFYDTLGNTNAVKLAFSKSNANEWRLYTEPARGTSVITLYDGSPTSQVYRSTGQLEFTQQPRQNAQVDINGVTYEFVANVADAITGDVRVVKGTTLSQTVSNLLAQVNTDPEFAAGATNHTATLKTGDSATIVLAAGTDATVGSIPVDVTNLTANVAGAPATRQGIPATKTFTVLGSQNTNPAIVFDDRGVPSAFNVDHLSVTGFSTGAGDMDDVTLDLGTVGEADGLTQFGAEFSPTFIEQDGARFGVFNGVGISTDGLMSALFDNGERRPIYRLPIVTFVNPNGMQSRTGNAWIATEESGNPTLREADRGQAGQIIQSSLESSTVDIGEEFTNMIVVQRAYSAATRIISTADEMLEELVRTKR
jgi:flagellar hook protein FlgE